MGRLIDDLLAFSRMSRVALRTSKVDLGGLVREVQQELAAQHADRVVEWRIGDLPLVDADPSLLHQVLVNLMANALKYTRTRDVARITIDWAPATAGFDEVVVFVRDNGVGFDMAYVNKLFGVFQRLHGSDEFEGTGIGLANVRRIVHRHGGRTWAEGEVGRGATFYFSLPHKGGEAA
jgi:light-regulated signal transduction histidine kinase (bacteriophytochrome)